MCCTLLFRLIVLYNILKITNVHWCLLYVRHCAIYFIFIIVAQNDNSKAMLILLTSSWQLMEVSWPAETRVGIWTRLSLPLKSSVDDHGHRNLKLQLIKSKLCGQSWKKWEPQRKDICISYMTITNDTAMTSWGGSIKGIPTMTGKMIAATVDLRIQSRARHSTCRNVNRCTLRRGTWRR